MYLVFLNILINTGYREKLFVKCKLLKKDGLIKDVFTERGDIKVMGDILSINQPKLCKVSKYQFYVQSLYACRIFFHHFEALKMKWEDIPQWSGCHHSGGWRHGGEKCLDWQGPGQPRGGAEKEENLIMIHFIIFVLFIQYWCVFKRLSYLDHFFKPFLASLGAQEMAISIHPSVCLSIHFSVSLSALYTSWIDRA